MNTVTTTAAARLERLLAVSPAVHYIAEASGEFAAIFISDSVEAQTGYTPMQFTRDPGFWASHIHPDDRSRVLSAMYRISESGTQVHEYRFRFADGSWHWMHDQMTLIRADDGRPVEIIGSWLDITKRRDAEEELRKRDREIESFFRSAGINMALKDSEGRFTRISQQFEKDFRLSEGHALGKLPQEVFPEPLADHVREQDLAVLNGARLIEEEYFLPDNHPCVWVLNKKFPVSDESGTITGMGSISVDISERKKIETALEESESQLRLITNGLPIPIVYVDSERRFRFVNHAVEAWYARPRTEILGKQIEELLHEDHLKSLRPRIDKLLAGKSQIFDERFTYPDGVTRDVQHICVPHRNAEGKVLGYYAMVMDITQRKHAEEALLKAHNELERRVEERTAHLQQEIADRRHAEAALRESEQQLRLIADGLPVLIVYVDTDLVYQFANNTAVLWYARPHEDIIGKHTREIHRPETVEKLRPAIDTVLSGERAHAQMRVTYPDGKTRDVDTTLLPDLAADGRVRGYYSMVLDITERVQAEALLRNSEKQLRLISDNLPVLIIYIDSSGRYQFVNKTAEDWLGVSVDALLGKTSADVLGEGATRIFEPHVKAVLCGETLRFDACIDYRTGQTRDVDITYVPNRDVDGKTIGYFVMVVDISERKRIEGQLYRYQDRLRALAAEISLAEQRERQRIATELHDRTIQTLGLTRIKLGALRASFAPADPAPLFDEVVGLIDGAIRDTRGLLFDISPPVLYELDFVAALEWLAERCEQRYELACELRINDFPETLSRELEVTLFQSVRELLANAGKHAGACTVQVRVTGENGRLRISVEDDGAGFSAGSGDPSARPSADGGFGLFNIRERLAVLGGDVAIDSRSGEGARVTLSVPL